MVKFSKNVGDKLPNTFQADVDPSYGPWISTNIGSTRISHIAAPRPSVGTFKCAFF
jgi:hypothetical protein